MPDSSIPAPTPSTTVPIVEERVILGRRLEETGALRVRLELERHEQRIDAPRTRAHVEVERIPVGRVVEGRREPWQDGDVTVVPVYAEQAVVTTRLVLVEEMRLRTRHETLHETATVELMRQRAVVERRGPDGEWAEVDTSAGDQLPPSVPTSGEQR